MPEYVISRSFSCRTERSERVLAVAEAFGLGLEEREFHVLRDLRLTIEPGDVVYITGQSGSGKSQLLRGLQQAMGEAGLVVADIDAVVFEDRALIDQIGSSVADGIELLARAGINDAYLMVRKPAELSDGQKYRFRLAKLFAETADVWIADEWGAVLDRTTAKVVSFNAQKLARASGRILIVATTHCDLTDELGPSITVVKRFNERVEIHATSAEPA